MERRKEARVSSTQPALLTILGGEGRKLPVTIENRSQSGLAIRVSQALPLSSPVRIDTGDQLLLGEVCHCSPSGDGYVVGLQVEHVVRHLPALVRLNQVLESEANRSKPSQGAERTEPAGERSH